MNWVSIDSDNGLSPIRRQAIIGTNAGLLSIGSLGTNFSDILIQMSNLSFTKMCLKYLLWKSGHFCQGEMSKIWIYPILYTPLFIVIDFGNWFAWRSTWGVVDVSGNIAMDGATVTSSSSSGSCIKKSKESLSKYLAKRAILVSCFHISLKHHEDQIFYSLAVGTRFHRIESWPENRGYAPV